MDISTDNAGIKFGDLQKQERYKRLERNLRLEYFKGLERLKADINKDQCTSPNWRSLSSINPDNDSSSANALQSLQTSKVGSEVIASSSNLHKVFPIRKYSFQLPMVTSSEKNFPINDYDKDRVIMPPPSTSKFMSSNTRRFSNLDSKQNEQIKSHDSSMKISSDASCSSIQNENFDNSQNSKHSRTFYRWRVLLNAQGQLVIKGTVDCGKIARSKPIVHRLSGTTVQSIYKHTYILTGPIADEKEELPDYVKAKFHNGFPDDWENVCQLWNDYVSGGCKESFRWPTRVTDSDDDLCTEMTDFSYLKSKQIQDKGQNPKIIANNVSSLGYYSRTQSDSNFNFEKSKEDKQNSSSTNKLEVDKSVEDCGHSSEIKDSNACSNKHEAKNIQDAHNSNANFFNSNSKSASFLSEVIKEEKLRTIMSIVGNKNCSPQYLDKLIELCDFLRYILSYTPDDCAIDCKKQDLSCSKSQNQVCEKCKHSTVSLVESSQEESLIKLKNKNECVKSDRVNKSLSKVNDQLEHAFVTENLKQSNPCSEKDHESSDSDVCMGVPHIPADRLIQSKSSRLQRYKNRRSRNRERNDAQVQMHIVAASHHDSSVSITEDDFEIRKRESKDNHFKEPSSKHANVIMKVRSEERTKMTRVTSFNDKGNENINTMNHKSNLPSDSAQNLIENQKPIIKSCEPAHYKLISLQNIKKSKATPPDITILSEDPFIKIKDHLNSKNKNQNENIDKNQEKLQKDILMHPFLTYDSENYCNENEAKMQIQLPPPMFSNKIKDQKISSVEKNKENLDDMLVKEVHEKKVQIEKSTSLEAKKSARSSTNDRSEIFGSKTNPKLLSNWVPYVDYDKTEHKLTLKFEGKLLNERGEFVHRKFVTNQILQRHSSRLIETKNNEFFKLVGNFNDTKHVVPKELLKQCITGCPSNIQEFCEDWKKLSSEERQSVKPENLHNISIDLFNIPTSKRGRRIVPTLSYWNGERLARRDEEVVYIPGNMKENFLISKIESDRKKSALSEKRPQRNKSNKDVNLKGSVSSKPSRTKESSDPEPDFPPKKRSVQKLKYSSEESSDSDTPQKSKLRKLSNEIQLHRAMKSKKLGTNVINRKDRQEEEDEHEEDHENARKTSKRLRSSRRLSPNYEWSYEKGVCYTDPDPLSDDQVTIK